jgi:hypothetical protein
VNFSAIGSAITQVRTHIRSLINFFIFVTTAMAANYCQAQKQRYNKNILKSKWHKIKK